jgi:hypothetical protein
MEFFIVYRKVLWETNSFELRGVPRHDMWAVVLRRTRSGITLDEPRKNVSARLARLTPRHPGFWNHASNRHCHRMLGVLTPHASYTLRLKTLQ